jgi:hypothetical protein
MIYLTEYIMAGKQATRDGLLPDEEFVEGRLHKLDNEEEHIEIDEFLEQIRPE